MPPPRVAVVGHTEWVTFARVDRLPRAGEIVHARETWDEPAGGGAIVAVLLARMAGACAFYTALGDDGAAAALTARGVDVLAAPRPATRRVVTHVDGAGERTITVLGERVEPVADDPLPWADLAGADAAFLTAGPGRHARGASVLVATPRAREGLRGADVDALVYSGRDEAEVAWAAESPTPRLRVETLGPDGGRWSAADGAHGVWRPVVPPGPPVDAYGCGDAFAAVLTLGLAARRPLEQVLHAAAAAGAACLTGRGPYGAIDRIAAASSGLA